MMRAPHFVRLAQIDEQRFITGCRHGLIHLTWGRNTIRFSRDEFRKVANLLERAASDRPPYSLRDGEFRAAYRKDDECELRFGPVVMLVPYQEFEQLTKAALEAVQELDRILASGAWDRAEPEEPETSFLESLRRNPFSVN
ncbi:MAG: hypothetical protein M8467_08995 [Anaerolineae bacterium]|nr:hypothetical protein [Anaerolineae bacterium]